MRVRKNDYIMDWEINRQPEIKELTSKGIIPYTVDVDSVKEPTPEDLKKAMQSRPWLMGNVAG